MFRKPGALLVILLFVLMPTASYAVSFTVRVIYFLPIDTAAAPNVDAKIDRLVKSAQKLFANEMERHGYGRKTFNLETNAKGEIVVHRVKGRFSRANYQTLGSAKSELPDQFVNRNNISLIFLEGNLFHGVLASGICGIGGAWINGRNFYSGYALVPAAGQCFNTHTTAHELGHTFGLMHNFENHRYLMTSGGTENELAPCEAAWLSEHHYFNKTKILNNAPKVTHRYEPQAELENKIRLKVALEDPDGLHYVHFYGANNAELLGYQSLNGNRDIAEVIVRRSKLKYYKEIHLQAMDLNGNYYIYDIPISALPESIDPEPIVREKPPPPDFSYLKNIDVDGNGFVNIADLEMVISNLGKNIEEDTDPNPDINRDGVVNQADVDLMIKQLNAAAAPTAPKTPERTQLLANYPNPFNPETWIPYALSEPTAVHISIYAGNGQLVRTLDLGHQPAGIYYNCSRAAYWNGHNAFGEPVASGVYFYTITAGDFTATRKMLIRK